MVNINQEENTDKINLNLTGFNLASNYELKYLVRKEKIKGIYKNLENQRDFLKTSKLFEVRTW